MAWQIEKVNLTYKNISDFTGADTIYLTKTIRGYSYCYYCKFVGYRRGCVSGKVLQAIPNPGNHEYIIGKTITARLRKCYLYGKDGDDKWERCHWFGSSGVVS